MTFTLFIDYLGTFAFAISGIRRASAKRFDLFGAMVVGFATGCGGGTLRDIMLGQTPFWMQSKTPFWEGGFTYLLVVLFALALVSALGRYLLRMNDTIFIFDAIGLGLFTVVGIEKTLACGFPIWVAILMGMVTGAGGGVFRDIFINVEPLVFRKDIYALACVFGGLVYVGCVALGLDSVTTQIVTALSVIALRGIAMTRHWTLPVLRRDVAEYDENDSRVWRDFGKTPSEGVGCFNLQVVAASMSDIAEINDSDAAAVELCSAPELGGLTPDRALMRDACAQSRLPVSVMIRPTDRDFVYTEDEFATMLDDVAYVARETKAEGISVGVLTADGNVDVARLRRLIEVAGRLKISFNRAFEQTNDPVAAYAQLARLKVASILTTVSPTLDLLPRAPVRLRVGGGVKPEHLPDLRSRGLMNIHMGRAVRRKLTFESSVDSSKVWEFTHA